MQQDTIMNQISDVDNRLGTALQNILIRNCEPTVDYSEKMKSYLLDRYNTFMKTIFHEDASYEAYKLLSRIVNASNATSFLIFSAGKN